MKKNQTHSFNRRQFVQGLATLPVFLSPGLILAKDTKTGLKIRRQYVDGPFGQVHVYSVIPKKIRQTPLMCFHPSPTSGGYFRAYMKAMGVDRMVFAMDTPGYGNSDAPPEPPTIQELAEVAAATLEELGFGERGGGPVDAIGYHTGCFIAAELAVIRPDLIRRLVLPGIPFHVGEDRQAQYEKYAKPKPFDEDGSHVDDAWKFWVTHRTEGVSLKRAHEHFSDQMRAEPNAWWAYHGVFSYEADKRFPLVQQPVLIPNNHGGLMEESRAAAEYLKDAKIIEMPELVHGIFDVGVEPLVQVSREFLDH